MTKFILLIKKADGSLYWQENFDKKIDLNRWLKTEQSKPYWKPEYVVEIVDNSAAVEEAEAKAKADYEAAQAAEKKKRQDAKAAVKAFKDKPSKTIADVSALLLVLIDILDLKPD